MAEDTLRGRIARKVAKLRALAEHPNTPESERLNATAQMTALMDKYALDEFMIAHAEGKRLPDRVISKRYDHKSVYHAVYAQMVWQLAKALNMKAIRGKLGGSAIRMTVVGFERDFELFDFLLATGLLQLEAASTLHRRSVTMYDWLTASQKYNDKRSFGIGFANGFAERVEQVHRQVERDVVAEHGTGAELVLVDRKQLVAQEYASLFPRTKKVTAARKVTGSYDAGQAAGRRADVGGTKLGGSRTAIGN